MTRRPDGRWHPLGARSTLDRPNVGDLLAVNRGVWRVLAVTDEPIEGETLDRWQRAGMPEDWTGRPYRIRAEHIAGVRPDWVTDDRRAGDLLGPRRLDHYPRGRWPACSCCGEPMPCRAQAQDEAAEWAGEALARAESIAATGACSACGEPITTRQRSVTYAGTNLDLPGAPPPAFHRRRECAHTARRYEERWLAADPRNERILTWPKCGGWLVVHGDGTSECSPDVPSDARDLLGGLRSDPAPGCRGASTHDHGSQRACLTTGGGCPRGCSPAGHPGCRASDRRERSS